MHISIIRKTWWQFLVFLVCLLSRKQKPEKLAPRAVKKILFVRIDRVGDMLLSQPAIRALKDNFMPAKITVLSSNYNRRVIEGDPCVDEILSFSGHFFLRSPVKWIKMVSELRKRKFDLAIDPYLGFFLASALLVRSSRSRWKLGFGSKHAEYFFNLIAKPDPAPEYEVERSLDLIRSLGISAESRMPEIRLDKESENKVQLLLQENKINDTDLLFGINPGTRRKPHRWKIENFRYLVELLNGKYRAATLVFWGPGEKKLAEKTARNLPSAVLAPATDVKLLACFIKRCRVFVCGDTGPFHIAVAVKTPAVGIFGKSDYRRWAPPESERLRIIRGKPCREITVGEVMAAVEALMENNVAYR